MPLLLLGLLVLISTLNPHVSYGSIGTKELEYERDLSLKGLGYTPINNVTNHIMEEVARELRTSDLLLYFFNKKKKGGGLSLNLTKFSFLSH